MRQGRRAKAQNRVRTNASWSEPWLFIAWIMYHIQKSRVHTDGACHAPRTRCRTASPCIKFQVKTLKIKSPMLHLPVLWLCRWRLYEFQPVCMDQACPSCKTMPWRNGIASTLFSSRVPVWYVPDDACICEILRLNLHHYFLLFRFSCSFFHINYEKQVWLRLHKLFPAQRVWAWNLSSNAQKNLKSFLAAPQS